MDMKSLILSLAVLVTIATCTDTEQDKSLQKRSVEGAGAAPVDALAEDEAHEDEKRRLMRYGRGALMRYGRGGLMRYGKRGGLMRYGKRDDDEDYDEVDSAKRLFRWGKRSDDEAEDFKRLFRWGKRDDESFLDEAKRRLMRYGKRSDDEEVSDFLDAEKRRLMRYGKRDMADEEKRRLMRYGRDIDTRAQAQPHVPFRFGEREE